MWANFRAALSGRLAVEVAVLVSLVVYAFVPERAPYEYPEIEAKLRPVVNKLGLPEPGEWLAEHPESGQSFALYVASEPQRRSRELNKIYVCLVGKFSDAQERVLAKTTEFLGIYYDSTVVVDRMNVRGTIANSPPTKPVEKWRFLLVNEILSRLSHEPAGDSLARVAFVANELWPTSVGERDWSYMFGESHAQARIGVWSLAAFGDPAESHESYQRTLRLTLRTAVHETGHILSLPHCVEFVCCLNGANHLREAEKKPLVFCPTCYRKLCWNLQIDAVEHLKRLEKACRRLNLSEDAELFSQSIEVLAGKPAQ